MAATYSLTLRSDLNRKLTIEEMDNNFLYLDNKSGGSASATLPIVTNLGTGTASYNQGNNFIGLGLTYSGQIFDTGSGGYNVIVSVDGTAADDAKDLNLFGYFEPNGDSANVSTRYDSEKSLVNIETTSLTFSAGITVGASTTHSSTFVKFSFSGVTSSSYYYFPSSNPQPGQVLGYDGVNQLGWVTNVGNSYLPLSGGTMDGAIYFGTGGQSISQGSFDNGLGGNKGIALNCAINYELNWQAGHLSSYYNSGYVPIIFDSNIHINGQSEISMGSTFSPSFFAGVDMLDSAYLKLKTGNEGVGKVLTSDSNGYASWKNSSILLGKKIGFDANLQATMTNATIQYQNVVGTFMVGEIIRSNMGATGSEAIILSDLTSTLTLDSGYDDFTESQQIIGLSSGALAEVVSFTYLTTADQVINLSGGDKYLISQVIITNATSSVGSMGTADQLSIFTGPTQSGYKLYDSISGIPYLATSDHFISSNVGMGMVTNVLVSDGLVYASLRLVVGATASFDIYLYGYIF